MKIIMLFILIFICFSCNNDNCKIKEIITTSSSSGKKQIQRFDSNGNIVYSEIDFEDMYGINDEVYEFEYTNNKLIKRKWYFRENNSLRLYKTDIYKYDTNGNILEKTVRTKDNKLYWKFDYKY